MLPALAFGFVAGILTILAPCTLPVVPFALGVGSLGGRRRTLGLLVGFGFTFLAVTVILASALAAAGLTTSSLRVAAAILLVLVGLSLALPRLGSRLELLLGPLARFGPQVGGPDRGDGFVAGLIVGGAIGLIWAPCVGPIMAAVIAVAVTHGPTAETGLIALAYIAGAAVPIGLIAGFGQRASRSLRSVSSRGRLQRSFGLAMALSGLLVVSGLDLTAEAAVANVLPAGWSGALSSVEQQPAIQSELDELEASGVTNRTSGGSTASPGPSSQLGAALPAPIATSLPGSVALENLGPAPELTGITAWINSAPLTMAALRGKVVLVEFWTFACINCIHVQPYVKAWYGHYAAAGLVVIGVHTPELSFEQDLGNVRQAVSKADVTFPVAFDPGFATWNAYRNNFWPAFYFVDRTGIIRHTHFGEGDYDGSEQVLRELLSAPG